MGVFKALVTVLDKVEDRAYAASLEQRQYAKTGFDLFLDTDGEFRLYQGHECVITGRADSAGDRFQLILKSWDPAYSTLESWLGSRVNAPGFKPWRSAIWSSLFGESSTIFAKLRRSRRRAINEGGPPSQQGLLLYSFVENSCRRYKRFGVPYQGTPPALFFTMQVTY